MPAALAQRTQEEELLWLALRMTPQLGPRRAVDLLRKFGSPVRIFQQEARDLEGAGLAWSVARSIEAGTALEDALEQQRLLAATGTQLLCWTDEAYPDRLREIYDPPFLLYARGNLALLTEPSIAVVGTRRPSPYGTIATERLSADLAQAGLTIVSGMARGIDTAAHKAALTGGGNTIAVLGCGADLVYPAENKKLAEEIISKGLLISEYPLRSPAYPQNFPVRNRIVSGLSYGVLIVEGAQYSGSAITARLALDQGKEVFAVPGNITTKQSFGPNLLIRSGARLVQSASDVLSDLPLPARQELATRSRQQLLPMEPGDASGGNSDTAHPMGQLRDKVLKALNYDEPQDLDQILNTLNRSGQASASELIAILFDLELDGMVRQMPGKLYLRHWSG
ncbi:MAG: DNA-processing protein DprA [Bryobacter sp.]|nr:DNA-processing protein DprA [Bryobacter sp.]